jgi:carbamoyltransferase
MKVIKNISYENVAELIYCNKIVAIFQGNDEGGPRALGNRSILFNPIHSSMLYKVNEVKLREWYRPFAGSILLDDFEDWFINGSIKESPFMTFAIEIKPEKITKIPAIVHMNKTCRVQTVTKEQNSHYYNLISAFKKISGVPIIGNTSFNLARQPIVHSISDALKTLDISNIDYLYLPEKECLVQSQVEE